MTLLSLRGFGVAFGDRIVLADVTFDVPRYGLVTLMGPAGSGKSTLLRTLAGLNDAHPALSTWGEATFRGAPLMNARRAEPGEQRVGLELVVQHAKFYTASIRENLVSELPDRASLDRSAQTVRIRELLNETGLRAITPRLDDDVCSLSTSLQRRLAIVRALVSNPAVLLVDEATAGLDEPDAIDVLALLRAEAHRRAVVFVTHNQRLARATEGTIVFLAGGRVLEVAPAGEFSSRARSPQAREFLQNGNCDVSGPNARPEHLDPERPPPPALPDAALSARSRAGGPRGFFWVRPGRLGGVPRPGIIDTVDRDLEGLQRLGVTTLVTLEETVTVPEEALGRFGITCFQFPIADMGVPTLAAGAALAAEIRRLLDIGEVVAVHCRAGLGRTGTTLAAQLVFDGETARKAIERVRRINPLCIQSQAQVRFLSELEAFFSQRANDPEGSGPSRELP